MLGVFKECQDSMRLMSNPFYVSSITKIQKSNGVAHNVVLISGGMDYLVFNCLGNGGKREGFIVCYPDAKVIGPACRNLSVAFTRSRNIINSQSKKQGR